ncbi:MAG: hypothetical protein KF713_02745 [Turneriella sp.]|jgi:hypothetical protein|nr:hypothetical protein [Turneriella sp.]
MILRRVTAKCSQVVDRGRYVQAQRPDGFWVFFDKANDPVSNWLNTVRSEADRRTVMFAIGLARGLQIAMNYAERYGDEAERTSIQKQIDALISNRLLTAI